ncbi:hypothetical protein M231_00250 [Tremella mesenterica]|uniref:Mss4-like protein n=1 Tax=Tremella mesenterica TaxID=5217 RepID=A0A4Q1BWZ8_TREME|nr:uncharacterized protein TREMEDRAFT_70880 [Tremella mesenterica DSM 1558]EIW72994.1 hypothetical protein TREMEDRAFT_70880 [Tremella mesenterica DSM 1558]RXK42694.1 hypothetical protein M231_00250 [Tremella mesenterica]
MSQPPQADIIAALSSSSSSRTRPPTQPYSSFSDPVTSLVNHTSTPTNVRAIHCPRSECASTILSPGAAIWVTFSEPVLPDDSAAPFPQPRLVQIQQLTSKEKSDSSEKGEKIVEKTQYGFWKVSSPYDFDNIGYSRPDTSEKAQARGGPGGEGKVKWLICAECDLGPLGWSFEGGKEAWVSADRVRYRGEIK